MLFGILVQPRLLGFEFALLPFYLIATDMPTLYEYNQASRWGYAAGALSGARSRTGTD